MKNIYLIGMPGVGKSSAGARLAEALHKNFIDLDTYIENKYDKKISDIIHLCSEDVFRVIEQVALKEISDLSGFVVSVGGGTPCFFDNMSIMNNSGYTVYLDSDIDIIKENLQCDDARPLIKNLNDVDKIYQKRKKIYEYASYQILFNNDINKLIKYIKEIIDYGNNDGL